MFLEGGRISAEGGSGAGGFLDAGEGVMGMGAWSRENDGGD